MSPEIPQVPDAQPESLAEVVRQRRAATTVELAEIIAAFPDLEQRCREARREIYMVMYDHALGRLTNAERDRIFQVLQLICPELFPDPGSLPPPETT